MPPPVLPLALPGAVTARIGAGGRSLIGSMRWNVCGSVRSRCLSTSDVAALSWSSLPAKMRRCSWTWGCSGCASVSACLISRTVPSMGTVRRSGVSGALALDGDLIRSSTVGMAGPGCACACKLGDACRACELAGKKVKESGRKGRGAARTGSVRKPLPPTAAFTACEPDFPHSGLGAGHALPRASRPCRVPRGRRLT